MGIHDREYYQRTSRGQGPIGQITSSAVGTIILINVVVWFIQAFLYPQATVLLAASPSDVFERFQVWRLLTANFAHSPDGLQHVFWNMLFLFFFGRDLERLYGKRDFYLLYLGSGIIAVLAELVVASASGMNLHVVGASGAVLAILMVFVLCFPTRTVLLFFVIPVPVWILCLMFVIGDISGALDPSDTGVAHFAHLTGALAGFLFRYYDLRWVRLQSVWRRLFGTRRKAAARGGSKVIPFPRQDRSEEPREEMSGKVAEISERIDSLLEKISSQGKESLTQEELDFLKENSAKYRSPRT